LAGGLAEKGVETHIVTNATCVEQEYSIKDAPPENPQDLTIHFIDPNLPWHIPYSELYIARLLDKTLEVIDAYNIDLIDTHYLVPYGIVGYLASKIRGIPYLIRHGGSDIVKFLKEGIFAHLLEDVIQDAAAVISDSKNRELFEDLNSNVHVLPRYIPDERSFKHSIKPHDIPTFAYIGKINYHWKHKSLDKIVDIFSDISKPHRLIFVAQGKGLEAFSEYILKSGLRTFEFMNFVHPANMPSMLSEVDFLFYLIRKAPIKDFSNILLEALCSGVSVITDEALDLSEYAEYIELTQRKQVIMLQLDGVETARAQVEDVIKSWEGPFRHTNKLKFNFTEYVEANLELYRGV